jgi:hypothetical protein
MKEYSELTFGTQSWMLGNISIIHNNRAQRFVSAQLTTTHYEALENLMLQDLVDVMSSR